MSWSEVVASISSATVTGGASGFQTENYTPGTPVTGSSVNWEVVRSTHAMQVTWADVSGGPAGNGGELAVVLLGSLDGENWYTLASVTGFQQGGTAEAVSTGIQPAQYVQAVATASTYFYQNGSQPADYTGTATVLVTSQ